MNGQIRMDVQMEQDGWMDQGGGSDNDEWRDLDGFTDGTRWMDGWMDGQIRMIG